METKTEKKQGAGPLSAPPCSAILSMPPETRSAVMSVIYRPQFLARVLREEAKSAEWWANVHADRRSYTQRKDDSGNWITKHDAYAARARMLRAAADVFDPPNDTAQQRAATDAPSTEDATGALAAAPCSAFTVGSRWRTFGGEEITVTMYYEKTPGCWRLCYKDNSGGGGHMGRNHIARLTPNDTPNDQAQAPTL